MLEELQPDLLPPPRPRGRQQANAQEARERRRRITTGLLWFVLGVLLINAVVGEDGYLATLKARQEAAVLRAEVAALRLENEQMQERAHRLQDDPAAVEEAARKMNFIRPGETLVILRDAKPGRPAAGER